MRERHAEPRLVLLAVRASARRLQPRFVFGCAVGLPRCSVGRSGSFSSGEGVGAEGVCALACAVSAPNVGREEAVDEEGVEFFNVGRSGSSFDGEGLLAPEELVDPPEDDGALS